MNVFRSLARVVIPLDRPTTPPSGPGVRIASLFHGATNVDEGPVGPGVAIAARLIAIFFQEVARAVYVGMAIACAKDASDFGILDNRGAALDGCRPRQCHASY